MDAVAIDAKTAMRMGALALVVFGISVLAGALIARSGEQVVSESSSTTAVEITEAQDSTTTTANTTTTTVLSGVPQAVSQTTTSIAPIQDFADLFEETRGAVASVDVVRCAANSQGSAFLVDPETAYTAWHVVEDAAEIALDFGEQRVEATVIGRDRVRDVAVLRLANPIEEASVIRVAPEQTRVGEEVAAIGHPAGQPLAMTVGRVTSVDGQVVVGDEDVRMVEGVLQTDSVAAPGSAGGPLVDQRGEVVGIVIQSASNDSALGYAVDIDGVRDDLLGWTLNPEPVRSAFCIGEVDLNDIDEVAPELINSEVDAAEVLALQRTFAVFTQSINSGRAEQAFEVLGPALTANETAAQWAEQQRTSKLWDWNIRSLDLRPDGIEVRSTVRSTQAAEFGFDGQSECTRWDLVHSMVLGEFQGREFWLINGSRPGPGGLAIDCADWEPTRVQRGRINAPAPGEEIVVEDFLAAGTIDAWFLRAIIPDGNPAQTFELNLTTIGDADRLGLTVVGGGDAGTSAQVVLGNGRVELDIGEVLDERGGDYRLTIRNTSPPVTAPPVDGQPDEDLDNPDGGPDAPDDDNPGEPEPNEAVNSPEGAPAAG